MAGENETTVNLEAPEVVAAIKAAAESSAAPLKTELEALKAQNSKLSEVAKSIEGVDIDRARELLAGADKSRQEDLLKNGEYEKLLNERIENVSKGYKSKLDESNAKLEALSQERNALSQRIAASEIARTAAEAGVHATAIDDVINRVGSGFTLGADGKVVAADGNISAKGVPLTIQEAVDALKETAPHLFGQSKGTGAAGSKSKGYQTAESRSKMTVADKTAYIAEHGQEAFLKLPK